MNAADRDLVVEFIEKCTLEIGGQPPNRGTLRQMAWSALTSQMKELANNHPRLRCIDRTRSRTRAQHVVMSGYGTYFLSQRPTGQIFTDFPQYPQHRNRNSLHLNVKGDTYYRIDRVIYTDVGHRPRHPEVAAIVNYCGAYMGTPGQQIKFLDAGGVERSEFLQMVDFAWPLDPN